MRSSQLAVIAIPFVVPLTAAYVAASAGIIASMVAFWLALAAVVAVDVAYIRVVRPRIKRDRA